MTFQLFRLQKYKKFESNSQQRLINVNYCAGCFDCKSTKNLRAIHNYRVANTSSIVVVSTAKVQKIWEQFTTSPSLRWCKWSCFDCKSTKNLRAIHNHTSSNMTAWHVVSTAKVQKIWEQFTTLRYTSLIIIMLFRLQKYKKFESNSQRTSWPDNTHDSCFDCKSTKNLRAIHNLSPSAAAQAAVVSTAKVQKIWEQFTTNFLAAILLAVVVSTAKVQKIWEQFTTRRAQALCLVSCFDCKSTKNLRAIHN